MTANQIAYQQMLETRRANLAKESETLRSNKANEEIGRFKASTDRMVGSAKSTKDYISSFLAPIETGVKVVTAGQNQLKMVNEIF